MSDLQTREQMLNGLRTKHPHAVHYRMVEHRRWSASCNCGWRFTGTYGEQRAETEKHLDDHRPSRAEFNKPTPADCPHCEYDRRFPGFHAGGWMQMDNNGPIVSCPACNPTGSHPRE